MVMVLSVDFAPSSSGVSGGAGTEYRQERS